MTNPTIKRLKDMIAECDRSILELQIKKREYRANIQELRGKELEERSLMKRAQVQVEIPEKMSQELKAKLLRGGA